MSCDDAARDAGQESGTAAEKKGAAPRTTPTNTKMSSSIESTTAKFRPLEAIVGLAESGVGVRDDVCGPLEPSPRFLRRDRERPHMTASSGGFWY